MEQVKEALDKNFPGSITIHELIGQINGKIKKIGSEPSKTKPAIALCRDDSVYEVHKLLHEEQYMDPFSMQTLAGMPVFGIDAVGAWYHHIPDKGVGLIIYAPHVGLDNQGRLGYLNREGIETPGKSCGANHILLGRWKEGNTGPFDNSPELSEVSRMLIQEKDNILNSDDPMSSLIQTELNAGLRTLENYVKTIKGAEHHKYPILLVSGIHIDIGEGYGNRFKVNEIKEL